jgi:hypothetical protein
VRAALFAALLVAGTNTGAAKAASDVSAQLEQAAEYYSLAMDAQGDEYLARLMLKGQDEALAGFGWAWIHSGEAGLMEKRLAAIGVHMRAHRSELSARKWEALRQKFCDAGEPCMLDEPAEAPADPLAAAADLLVTQAGAHRLLLVGEMHGTRETPELLAQLATRYAQQGPVVVVLELSSSIDAPLQRYLASDGGLAARKAFIADPYWHVEREHRDGRRNLEAINLIEQLRQLRQAGKAVSVVLMDNPAGTPPGSEARDKAMAERVRAAHGALPADGRMLVLAGNVHAMKTKPMFAPPELQDPMGSYLRDLEPYSANVRAAEGGYWACMPTCEPQAIQKQPVTSGPESDPAFDYRLALPRFTVARLIREAPEAEAGE